MISRINGTPATSVRSKAQAPIRQHVAKTGLKSNVVAPVRNIHNARRSVVVQAAPPVAAKHIPLSLEVQKDLNARCVLLQRWLPYSLPLMTFQ